MPACSYLLLRVISWLITQRLNSSRADLEMRARFFAAPASAEFALVRAFERCERPQAMLDLCEARFDDRAHNLFGRLVTRRSFIQRHAPVRVDDDASRSVLVINRALRERPHSFAARQTPARTVIDRITTTRRTRERPQDVTPIFIAAGDQDRMTGRLPESALQGKVSGRKRARRALAMHPHVAQLRVLFVLHEVVADLIDQLKVCAERLTKSFRHLLEDDQAIYDRVVAAGRDRIQIIAIVRGIRREVAEINVCDLIWAFTACQLEIVCRQPMPEAA